MKPIVKTTAILLAILICFESCYKGVYTIDEAIRFDGKTKITYRQHKLPSGKIINGKTVIFDSIIRSNNYYFGVKKSSESKKETVLIDVSKIEKVAIKSGSDSDDWLMISLVVILLAGTIWQISNGELPTIFFPEDDY